MSRINFSEEEIDKIITDYQNGKSQAQLAKEFKISRAPIFRVLKENGVEIRDVKTANSKQLPPEVINKIIYNYTILKKGLVPSGKEFNLSQEAVKNLLKTHGVKIRTYVEAKDLTRKYNLDDDFFKRQSHNMAYMLGFIAADGNIAKKENGIFIEIHQKDEALLHFFNEITKNTRPLKYYIHKHKDGADTPSAKFRAWSSAWKKDLAVYNIVPNKTFILKPPYFLENQYRITFLKGYFDGDGSIYYNKSKNQFFCSFIGASKEMIDWIYSFLATEYGIIGRKTKSVTSNNTTMYGIEYAKDNLIKLRKLWYESKTSDCCLERKKDKFYMI